MDFYFILTQILAQQDSGPVWLFLLGGLISSGVVTAALNFYFNRNKTFSETEKIDADAADIIQRAAGELIVRVQEQAAMASEQASRENKILQEQNNQLLEEVRALRVESNNLKVQVSRIPELELMIQELQEGVQLLSNQLVEHGISPVFSPSRRND